MTGIGLVILGRYLVRFHKAWPVVLIGLIAAGFKMLPIAWGSALWSRNIINPALAILSEAVLATITVYLVQTVVSLGELLKTIIRKKF